MFNDKSSTLFTELRNLVISIKRNKQIHNEEHNNETEASFKNLKITYWKILNRKVNCQSINKR
jgi:hypothetical protein